MMLLTETVKSVPTFNVGHQLSATSVTNINLTPSIPTLMLVTDVETVYMYDIADRFYQLNA